MASGWQHCVLLAGPRFESQTSSSRNERVTTQPMAGSSILRYERELNLTYRNKA